MELYNLYCSLNIDRVIKSVRIKYDMCCAWGAKKTHKVWSENLKRSNRFEDIGGRCDVILKLILKKLRCRLD
jgi:hypothetical protein